MTKQERTKANWCCMMCGLRYGRQLTENSTWHVGRCDVCKVEKPVTETRDFNYLNK